MVRVPGRTISCSMAKTTTIRTSPAKHFRLKCLAGDVRIVVVLAIEQEIVRPGTRTIHGETDAVREVIAVSDILHSGHSEHEFNRVPAEVGQILDLFSVNVSADFAGLRLEFLADVCLHGDGGPHGADFEHGAGIDFE